MKKEKKVLAEDLENFEEFKDFQDKVALITGAASGIGRATAISFAQNGVRTVLADVSAEAGEKLAAEIVRNFDIPSVFIKCDVSNAGQVKTLVDRAIAEFGHLDFAFNNAGIEGVSAATKDCTEENWDRVIDTNLKGIWLCMQQELEHMVKQGRGSIVNCASIAGLVGFSNSPAYTASKHGVVGLTKSAALEYAKSGIRINAVCPGVIDTPMITRYTEKNPEAGQQLNAAEPIGRIGKPEEISDAVLWLCSKRASFVIGQAIAIDGGWVAQ